MRWIFWVLLAVPSGWASAQPATTKAQSDQVATLSARAKAAFDEKQYAAAVRLYEAAYQLEPLATLLYNIAFIYDTHLKDVPKATEYYRRYVNAPDAEENAQVRAYERLAVLKANRMSNSAFAPLSPTPKAPVSRAPATTAPPAAPPSIAARPTAAPPSVAAKPAATERAGATKPTVADTIEPKSDFPWKPVLFGVSGVGLVAGAVFSGLAASTHVDYRAARAEPERGDLASTGQTQALVADIALGVGVAAGVAGLIVWLSGDDETALAPTTIGDAPGLFFGRRF